MDATLIVLVVLAILEALIILILVQGKNNGRPHPRPQTDGKTISQLAHLAPVLNVWAQKGGTGKCFKAGTEILMFDGSIKKVEDVVKGDLLMGPDSGPRRVLELSRGWGPMFKVTPTKGEPYVVNENHILCIKHSRRGRKTTEVSVHDFLHHKDEYFRKNAMGYRVGVEWPERAVHPDLPPYLLGLWLGDGNTREPAITTMEPEIISEMQSYCQLHGLRFVKARSTSKGRAATYFMSGSKKHLTPFTSALRRYGIDECKNIPHDYLANCANTRMELLAGIIDTDGSLSCNGFEILAKPPKLANDITFLARSLGFASSINKVQKSCPTRSGVFTGEYYRVFISGDVSRIPVRVARKKAGERKQIKDVLVTGIKVTPVGPDWFYGFEVDLDHKFLLGDFTVTHNSQVTAAIAIELSKTHRVGIVDCDVDSPYLPEIFGMKEPLRFGKHNMFKPCIYQHKGSDGTAVGNPIKIVSAFLFPVPEGTTVQAISKIGPEYHRIIRDLFTQTEWGNLDLLIADSPAGTADPFRAILNCSEGNLIGSVVVVQPKTINGFKRVIDLGVRMGNYIMGVIENQVDVECPHCKKRFELYKVPAGGDTIKKIASDNGITYFGSIPHIPGLTTPDLPAEYAGPVLAAAEAIRKEVQV